MAERIYGSGRGEPEQGVLRGMLLILVTGVVLGIAYNALGLASEPAWGLSWIAEDRAEIPDLEVLGADGASSAQREQHSLQTESDDPMAIPAAAASAGELPEIPDLGRPIQMQLPAVKRFFDAGAALIIDAREAEEYAEGHIAGAINLPYDEVITDPARLESLDSGGRPIITYCGGGTCELSLNLAYELVRVGHGKVLVFMGGYPEWVDSGYPTETGEGNPP